MQFKAIFAIAACLTAVTATPWKPTTTTTATTKPTTTTTPTTKPTTTTTTPTTTKNTITTTTTTASPAPTNNGQQFVNQCQNTGISIADCTQLLNIALLNGDTVNVGGSSAQPSAGAVNNGQQFLNECKNTGISILDCAALLNIAALNGLTIDISVAGLISLLDQLGLSLLAGLLGLGSAPSTSLVAVPTSI